MARGLTSPCLWLQTHITASHLPHISRQQLPKVALEMLFAESQFLESWVKTGDEFMSKSAKKCHNLPLLLCGMFSFQSYIICSYSITLCFYPIKYNPKHKWRHSHTFYKRGTQSLIIYCSLSKLKLSWRCNDLFVRSICSSSKYGALWIKCRPKHHQLYIYSRESGKGKIWIIC